LVRRAPSTPVIVLCHESDRAADQQAADAGIADFLLVPGLSADRLEHAIRFALSHQRTPGGLAASEERHALALKGSNDGSRHRDGEYRWMLARATAVRDGDGQATRMVGSLTDVTDRREAEHRLQHDALHDALTGLPNRVLFLDRLDQAIRRAQRSGVGGDPES